MTADLFPSAALAPASARAAPAVARPPTLPDRLERGTPDRLGAHWDGLGVNVAVFSAHAERIELCLFDREGHHEIARLGLPECTDEVWHGYLPGAGPGLVYGLRAHGAFDPAKKLEGLRGVERLRGGGAMQWIEFPYPFALVILPHAGASQIDREFAQTRQILRTDTDQESQSGVSEDDANGAANQTEQDTLDKQPGGNPAPARAERGANRKLLLTALRSDE